MESTLRRSPLDVLRLLGPGLITGAADDDPSGIATCSQAGAQSGYSMPWTMVFTLPLKVRALLFAILVGLPLVANAQQGAATARVIAWGHHLGGRTFYTYEVHNLHTKPIYEVVIGHYPPVGDSDGHAELSIEPVGTRSGFVLDSEGARRPDGWGALLIYPEESRTFWINWTETTHFKKLWPGSPPHPDFPLPGPSGHRGIMPGTTRSGFAAVLPSEDFLYVKGHATVVYEDESINVPITAGDPTPPSITLNVGRVNQNDSKGEWAIFSVGFSASDNHDPEPRVRFDVLANPQGASGDIVLDKNNAKAWNVRLRNVPGTTYTLRVTAVDASGNSSTKDHAYAVDAAR